MKTRHKHRRLQLLEWVWLSVALVVLVNCATPSEQKTPPASSSSASANPNVASSESVSSSINSPSPTIVAPEIKRSPEELWSLLRQTDARYAVLIRHATAPGTGDPPNFQLEDCSTQRNLSEAGRQQARRIGEAFRNRNIPVARILSSQWCRCLETAELMNAGKVEPFPPLNSFFGNRDTAATQTARVQQFLLENQAAPGVIIMVTHRVNITALSDVFPQSGEAVILQIRDDNQFIVLGQIPTS